MLAPDLDRTEAALANALTAAEAITLYAGAMRDVVGPMIENNDFPDGFGPVTTVLARAVRNGSNWIEGQCIDLTTAVPGAIITFGDRFQEVSTQLINLQAEITLRDGTATAVQQKQAIELFITLKSALVTLETAMKAENKRIMTLLGAVRTDHDSLTALAATVDGGLPDGGRIAAQITGALGDDYLDVRRSGRCDVRVSIRRDIAATITQIAGPHHAISPYLIAQAVLAKALMENANAKHVFGQILGIWGFMEGLVDSAIEDLANSAAKDVIAILQEARLDMAQSVWSQLSVAAQNLLAKNTPASE